MNCKRIVSFFLVIIMIVGVLPLSVLAAEEPVFVSENASLNSTFTETDEATILEYIYSFPESYREKLLVLHQKYPSWVFIPVNTGLDWADAVNGESSTSKSMLMSSSSYFLKSLNSGDFVPATGKYVYKDAGFVGSNSAAVAYFMDPRNFLVDQLIFQFEVLSYDPSFHTIEGVEAIIDGSFMDAENVTYLDSEGNTHILGEPELDEFGEPILPEGTVYDEFGNPILDYPTYAELIMRAAETSGVSPYYLASKIMQEVGKNGSGSVSGKYGNYPGIYNFYNIGATSGTDPISNGLKWASNGSSNDRPWTDPEKAIIGGACWIGASYINAGQDTGYLQKFNVVPLKSSNLYAHQYMGNIAAPAAEAIKTHTAYNMQSTLSEPKLFRIPVYENMPTTATQPSFTTSTVKTGHVNNNSVIVRGGAGKLFTKVGQLEKNAEVTILGCSLSSESYTTNFLYYPYWYHVQYVASSGATVNGYVCADYITPDTSVSVKVGNTRNVACTLTPNTYDVVYYQSSDYTVATVDKSGLLTAKKAGKAYIYAFTSTGGLDILTVEVVAENSNVWTTDCYSDVPFDAWYTPYVRFAYENGLTDDIVVGSFEPNTDITRAMFVTFLARLAGVDETQYSPAEFKDTPSNQYYSRYVQWAVENGIVLGYDDGTFRPNANIKRQEMCAILVRCCNSLGIALPVSDSTLFADDASIATWAKSDVYICRACSLVQGKDGNIFDPKGTTTRAHAVTLFKNLYDNFLAK